MAFFFAHWRVRMDAVRFSQLGYLEMVAIHIANDIPLRNFLLAYFLKNASCTTGRAR